MIKEVKFIRQTTMNVYYEVYGENLTETEIDNNSTISADSLWGNEIRIDGTTKAFARVTCYKD